MGISPKQFAELQRRVTTPRRPPGSPAGGTPQPIAAPPRLILGIDPSLRGTGWGIVGFQRPHSRAIAYGTIRCPASWERSRCLARITETLRDVLRGHAAEVCAIEALFYAQNIQTALIMGEARGAAMATIALAGLPIFEIAPRKVKLAIAGHGTARKSAVARMVQRLTRLAETPDPDAADALAIALAYIGESGRQSTAALRRV